LRRVLIGSRRPAEVVLEVDKDHGDAARIQPTELAHLVRLGHIAMVHHAKCHGNPLQPGLVVQTGQDKCLIATFLLTDAC
jgi:hypothetical protein